MSEKIIIFPNLKDFTLEANRQFGSDINVGTSFEYLAKFCRVRISGVVRGDIKQWNQMLAEAAHNTGVITSIFVLSRKWLNSAAVLREVEHIMKKEQMFRAKLFLFFFNLR